MHVYNYRIYQKFKTLPLIYYAGTSSPFFCCCFRKKVGGGEIQTARLEIEASL